MLTNLDLHELTEFRRVLHRFPEVSGQEAETARRIATALRALSPSRVLTGLGGHGVAAVFDSGVEGPSVLFRAELDALPIAEQGARDWASTVTGKSHACGHDGHMTMLLALGRIISRRPVARGRVILMFQPAEEDGSGAKAVVSDPAFREIKADYAFAFHNQPGQPLGAVSTCEGLVNCASKGLRIKLSGKTAHAAEPECGISPARAVAELIPALEDLGRGGVLNEGFGLVTITHASIGEPTFGIAPGEAEIFATLRVASDTAMQDLEAKARELVTSVAANAQLGVEFATCDDFAASINDPEAVEIATNALSALGIIHSDKGVPMRASEDFGVFGWSAKPAMLWLGSGEDHPALHNPDYDFPDDLIPIGSAIFERIARDILGAV